MLTQHVLTFPLYIPRILRLIENWPSYLRNYLLRLKQPSEYYFRSGFRLIDATGTLAGTIAVVFIRREYGQLTKDCRVIIDIGANMGSFAIFAATHSPNAKIYCFEPEPGNFSTLTRNISINSLTDRVITSQSAVASSAGEQKMIFGESPLNSLIPDFTEGNQATVKCTTLHDILANLGSENVDFLKVNCEGAEYQIFSNCASEDLARIINIRVEYHNLNSPDGNGDWLANLFIKHGYTIERFTRYKRESGFIWASRR